MFKSICVIVGAIGIVVVTFVVLLTMASLKQRNSIGLLVLATIFCLFVTCLPLWMVFSIH